MIIRNLASFGRSLLLVFLMAYGTTSMAQVSADAGKTLFRNYCASCHDKGMQKNMTGPALAGVQERWADYPESDLYAWIRNSQALIASGHPRATELWETYNGVIMTAYPNLTDDDIGSLLEYINGVANGTYGVKAGVVVVAEDEEEEEATSPWLYVGLLGLLAILALVLARVIGNLNVIATKKENPDAIVERKSILDILTSKGLIGFVLFAFVLLGGYTTVNNAVSLGRQQGYAPEQPIKFSHETHAGLNKIECQYCHDGARRSKHSVIPATNTCMNCHKAINYGSEYGTAEITKIYASVGYDPIKGKYIENYENMPEDSISMLYKDWIKKANAENDEELENATDEQLRRIADKQFEALKASLTNEVKNRDTWSNRMD